MEKIKRLNREFNLDINDNMLLKYGTANKDNPIVLYVSGKCWVTPIRLGKHKETLINSQNVFIESIKKYLCNGYDFNDRFILDYDVSLENLKIGSKKYLSFDLFIKQINVTNIKELKPMMSDKVGKMVKHLVENLENNGFLVDKTKKITQV